MAEPTDWRRRVVEAAEAASSVYGKARSEPRRSLGRALAILAEQLRTPPPKPAEKNGA